MKGKRLPASIRSILLNNDLASLLPLCHSLPTGRIYGHRLKTFLHLACKYSTSLSLLRHLIHTLHMNPHLPLPRTGVTCLHYACGRGSLRVVRFLVEEMGCDVNVRGPYGLKPLGVAVRFGREEVALWLLERTSRPLEPGRHRWTIAHWAAYRGSVSILSQLGRAGWSGRTDKGEDVSMLAARAGHQGVLDLLIRSEYPLSLDVLRSAKGNWELVEWLLLQSPGLPLLPSLLMLEAPVHFLLKLCANEDIDLSLILKHDRADLLPLYLHVRRLSPALLYSVPHLPPLIYTYLAQFYLWSLSLPLIWAYETFLLTEVGSDRVVWSRIPKHLVREIASFL